MAFYKTYQLTSESHQDEESNVKIDAYVVEEINAPFVRETLELDAPGPGEILVKIKAVGVCHTDLNTQSGDMPLPLPGVFWP